MIRALLALLFLVVPADAQPYRFQDKPLALNVLVDGQTLPTAASGTGGTATADLVSPFSGSQSVRLTAGPSSTARWTFTFPTVNICNDSFIEVTLRVPNQSNVLNLNLLELYLGNLTDGRRYEFGSFDVRDTGITYHGEWAQVRFPIRRFGAPQGAYTCASVSSIVIGQRAQTGTQDTLSIARVSRYPKRDETGIFLIHEDDQWKGWYDYAVPTLLALGLKSDVSVNGGRVGTVNFMTRANLQTLCESKYTRFMNHGWLHDSITDLSLPDARYWISRNSEYIRSFGPSCDESGILILPFGKHSRPVDSAVRAWTGSTYMPDYMRLTKGNGNGEAQNFNSPFAMRVATSLGQSVDTTTAKAIIDSAVAQRTVIIFLFHQICDGCTPSDDNTWRKDWFISVMNYAKTKIDAGLLRNMFTGEYLKQYGGGIGRARRTGIGR